MDIKPPATPKVDKKAEIIAASESSLIAPAMYSGPHFSYSEALVLLKKGFRMARSGWNGKGMYIVHIPYQSLKEDEVTYNMLRSSTVPVGESYQIKAHIMMFTADKEFVPWLASNTDQCEDDWEIAGIPASFNILTY